MIKLPATAKRTKIIELKEQMRMLHENFAKKVTDSGLTRQEIEEAVRKARKDVRKAHRSSGN
ncbi:MAG: hypothetical protein A4E53_00548 [Pelotomaculum sp. PtaB.Bin104]|nr:MAG: hypothetical protein A4E53_00548 [Pelotomaculum sp. PtaB.Bin104]